MTLELTKQGVCGPGLCIYHELPLSEAEPPKVLCSQIDPFGVSGFLLDVWTVSLSLSQSFTFIF